MHTVNGENYDMEAILYHCDNTSSCDFNAFNTLHKALKLLDCIDDSASSPSLINAYSLL